MHTALDATNCRELAEFYSEFLGLRYRDGDEPPIDGSSDTADWLVLVNSARQRVLAVNQVRELVRPTWPSDEVPKQMHQDFRVTSIEELHHQCQRALELGATVLLDRTEEHEEPLVVLADPAGHPFCILVSA